MAKPIKPRKAIGEVNGNDVDRLRLLQGYIRTYFNTTELARVKWIRDYEMVEGNGKQWSRADRAAVEKTGRPALEFNQILPQVELVSGMHRSLNLDFDAIPRGLEDRRLGEIAAAALKATQDFTRLARVNDRVFDDGTICGLGVWEILHSIDDAEDMVWGDIVVSRLNPLAFLFDPWATEPDFQDGAFMGKATWMHIDDFKDRYPEKAHLAKPGEWLSWSRHSITDSTSLGTGPSLIRELFDMETGRIRLLTMWHKVPSSITLIIDTETGQVQDVPNQDTGEAVLEQLATRVGQEGIAHLQIVTQDETSVIMDSNTGQPMMDQTLGQPLMFGTGEGAMAHLDQLSEQIGMQVYERFSVVKRKARVPEWTEMCWWETLKQGKTPFKDRRYPFVTYVSRQFSDDPESIMGIVRNLHDPQDEYNKRYSNILAHLNSSSHSGWMNRRTGGANKQQLELMGSKPGIVVEFASVPPTQIKPVELSSGHFAMLQNSERQVLRISGINAELVGQTTQTTVSGRAIRARQEGGSTILKPRFRNYEESQQDLGYILLSRIQQFYPVEKLKRIIGIAELQSPMGQNGQSIFAGPIEGSMLPDEQIMQLLGTMKTTKFDLALRLSPASATERQAQFEQATQLAGLITASGKPLGPNTMQAMIDLADMPTRLAEGLKRDAEQEAQAAIVQPGGQNDQIQKMIAGGKKSNASSDAIAGGMP